MQGRADDQRELLDAESVAGHLLKSDSMFAFLAAHRSELFPEEMFADLFPSRRGRPSVPAEVMASVITLQALHGLSDNETVEAVTFDLRWKAACGLPITVGAFHSTTLTYWRRRLAASDRPNRIKLSRQPYYRWLADPITEAELIEAYRANALFDAHADDPEFGYRYLVEEARDAGEPMAERTAWRICSQNRLWSVFGKKRGKNGKVGPPVHDDLVERDFTAEGPNQLWLSDITEHRTGEGKLYLCAIKDVFSNRIVGYSIDSRMKS
ncbi:transposase, partial [Mycolicibacterium sp. NCC-Tsukiji]|uniref:transposase n=1 Tax=Mycolicibacterium sp. NCC-Tsukiji TaxID=2185272 RepID=UPI001FCEC22E